MKSIRNIFAFFQVFFLEIIVNLSMIFFLEIIENLLMIF